VNFTFTLQEALYLGVQKPGREVHHSVQRLKASGATTATSLYHSASGTETLPNIPQPCIAFLNVAMFCEDV
jgi:hypothetical protein